MAGLKRLVAVTLALTVVVAIAAYVLRPAAPSNTGNVVVNEPDTGTNPDTGGTGGSDTGTGTNPGDEPASEEPPAHGKYAQNSNGPKHAVCLPANSHVPDHAADEGANRYRGTCADFRGKGPSE